MSAYLHDTFGFEVVAFKGLEAGIKARLGTEEEPFEGEIPLVEYIAEMKKSAAALQGARGRCVFAFDDFPGADKGALAALVEAFGLPEHVLELECERPVLDKRFMTKNEIEGEIGEEQRETLNREDEAWKAKKGALEGLRVHEGRVRVHIVHSDVSAETTHKQLNALFAPRVVVVNHEKRLVTDTTCANLAIKYNMVYVSVYQLIRRHLTQNTCLGKKLRATRKPKEIAIQSQAKDEFDEVEYSAAHFDLHLIIEMIKQTIAEVRTNEKFILLEGMFNTTKFRDEDDKLAQRYRASVLSIRRFSDELFLIEKEIGEVIAIASLQF